MSPTGSWGIKGRPQGLSSRLQAVGGWTPTNQTQRPELTSLGRLCIQLPLMPNARAVYPKDRGIPREGGSKSSCSLLDVTWDWRNKHSQPGLP